MPNIPSIIYQDSDIVVLNKPAGLITHHGPVKKDYALTDFLITKFPQVKNVGEPGRPGIVHRLDEDTSGLLVVALNQRAYLSLTEQFKNRQVHKKYYAFCFGVPKDKKGFVLGKINRDKKNRKRMGISYDLESGKEAKTNYEVKEIFKIKNKLYSLIEASPESGRTHQIRVHLKKLGCPLLGDKIYKFKRQQPPFPIDRQMLHAFYLQFMHPSTKERKEYIIDLTSDLKDILNKLKNADNH